MPTPKNTEPIILIILTGIAVYALIKSKKGNHLRQNFRHHIITPSMKALRMKSIMNRELKKATGT